LSQNRGMLTPDQLSKALHGVNVKDFSKAADISEKTIYRLRQKTHKPSFETLQKILAALERQRRAAAKVAA
jgi:predicted transcriptional regulator